MKASVDQTSIGGPSGPPTAHTPIAAAAGAGTRDRIARDGIPLDGTTPGSFPERLQADLAAVARIGAVPAILRVISEVTGLRLALVARVTHDAWTACAVLDRMSFGLEAGDHLDVATTLCSEVRDSRAPILIEHASREPAFCAHPTPKLYGFESYIAVPIVRPNGEYFGNVCALDAEPARLRDEKTLSMMQLFADLIGLQLAAEEEAVRDRHALAREREAAELREQFIAVLGHDLRNPLSAILAAAGFLLDLAEHPTQRALLARIRTSGGRMARLIDDIMDFARGRLGGGVALTRETVPVGTLVEDVVAEIREAHPDRVIDVAAADAGAAWVDRGRVAQLLSNLVANAVEHGAADAPIAVAAACADGRLRLSVTSRGRPIPAEAMARLFQPYYRAGDGRAGDAPRGDRGVRSGLGLGLFIADAIARAHGGTITATSSPDGVTTFAVALPAEPGLVAAGGRAVGADTASAGAPAGVTPETPDGAGLDPLYDPARLHLLADTGLVDASTAARLPTLDRAARLAARATRAPLAQVNVITADAQVPVAAFVDPTHPGPGGDPLDPAGADLAGAWRTPVGLDASYCQHVVRIGSALVIEDARAHPLVRDSRATHEAGIGAYAAVPLVAPSGAVLGSVCVVAFAPRAWSVADVAALEECAALAGEEVAARLGASRALRESEAQLRRALEDARAARDAAEAARDEAQEARRQAEGASRAKSEFLATMSHELRTPLNAIGGYAELLELGIRGPVTEQQREDLRRVQASQRHLLGLVNEVLNYARLETGRVPYDLADVSLAAAVASVAPLVAPQLAAKGLTLRVEAGEPPPVARADADKVRQVLLNLLSNAVKFTDAGGRVTITCAAAGGRATVQVTDTGIGVAAEALERIFEPFVQASASLTRAYAGAGLGLAISRDLARGMGGDLTAESRLGVGSTFTLTLPRA